LLPPFRAGRRLGRQIEGWLKAAAEAGPGAAPAAAPRAIIAPHAGHRYCGHVMGNAYAPIDAAGV
jgi:AmmeMemoRadiSam system protein B